MPPEDLGGFDLGGGRIERAHSDPTGRFDHVLLGTDDRDVFLVIVIDVDAGSLWGHHLLDLPRFYWLR